MPILFKQYINIVVIDQSLIFTIFHAFDEFFSIAAYLHKRSRYGKSRCPKSIFSLRN